MTSTLPPRPTDATLSVTKAARLLGVHPNTVRAWSDAGRLRYYRINPRGDRRYRMGDLQRFLAAAESAPGDVRGNPPGGRRAVDPAAIAASLGAAGRGPQGARDGMPLGDARAVERHGRDLREVRDNADHTLVAAWELRGDRLVPRTVVIPDGGTPPRLLDLPRSFGV